ncbi:galactoside-binding lectin [Ancylostoma ceylanicum]|uniref:Galectin n=1 Tax=Ancylostoma ceylanicum TaxID=53326 RepID=A0A0D6LJK8_9BILA|nr:galactoside-binding lectin [Ancylostoma ceylanicum]
MLSAVQCCTTGSIPFRQSNTIRATNCGQAPGKFAIDFRDTNRDLMLHFNPRFKHGYIAINAFKNNVWQREKRIPSPFEYEKVYTVDFVFKENSAIMYVNGQFLYEYVQRLPGLFKKASSVGCYGDLDIHSVHIA